MVAFRWNSSKGLIKERSPRASVSAPSIRKSSQWEHTWTDTSARGGFLVWRGRFAGGAIDLSGQWEDETGRQIRSRLTWSRITDRTAHWESHRSLDEGKTWTKHWVVDFTRKTA